MKEDKSSAETPDTFRLEKVCHSGNLVKNLLEIIESHPSEAAINFGRSIIYYIEDDYVKMVNSLEFLIDTFPNIPLLHLRIAEVAIYENKYQKAIIHLKKALELEKDNLTAKIWLTLSYFKVGETKEANNNLSYLKDFVFVLRAKEISYREM